MDRHEEDQIVELGTASVETRGNDFKVIELGGLRAAAPGIADD